MQGVWERVEVAGHPVDLYRPAQANAPFVLYLHGHGLETLWHNETWSAEFDRHGFGCICPHGARSWWLDKICSEFDDSLTPMKFVLDHVVPYLGEQFDCRPPRIALAGVSMGGQGALQIAYRHPRKFPVVAAISPAIDFHNWIGRGLPLDEMFASPEAARQETAILRFQPLNWPKHQMILCDPTDAEWIESSERLSMKLRSMGIRFVSDLETSNGGHTWEYFNSVAPKVMSFLAERLEKVELPVIGKD
ncbi:alpha/beta hydrolase [Calycomorphotria hydatis]|uniref:Esterase n=1 Tax=Calycomorphotria hydatis TaxID=2528027 RepID=A0A517T4I9_9PLAN|nr:alpha/beta hydrolase-fold protein [Calycomorphotria hydatis]QDT63287.1 Putative esterase [Calycomorphotria hydatis]